MAIATTPVQPPPSGRPHRSLLLRLGGLVLILHWMLLVVMAGQMDWQINNSPKLPSGVLQTRMILAGSTDTPPARDNNPIQATAPAKTRLAIEKVTPQRAPTNDKVSAALRPTAATIPDDQPRSAQPTTAPEPVIQPLQAPETASEVGPPDLPETVTALAPANDSKTRSMAELNPADEPPPPPTDLRPSVTATESLEKNVANPDTPTAPISNTTTVPSAPPASATQELPKLALSAMPASALLSYRLQGQEKGINYNATGELRWQRNDSAYAMGLTVRALLLGSRHWRSQGLVTPEGLAPLKFSDSWRSERAAHFDRPNQRIVFSSNAPTVALQAGAQDQVSLYVQLAAAMAQQNPPLPVGTRLQIQTATVRDALPWLLSLEKTETLQLDGGNLQTTQWVCHPRNRFDARVEFWVAAEHDWLPARIRITQSSGSFIDLQLTGRTALPDLPAGQTPG